MRGYALDNRAVYDELAEEYAKRAGEYKLSDRKIAAPFIDHLNAKFPNARVLELGPGSGLNLSFFADEGFRTWGIDISQKMIDLSRRLSPGTEYFIGDLLDYDFKNLRFEGIFAKEFIHLLQKNDAVHVLKKARELLVPSGALFLGTTVHGKSEEGYFEKSDYSGQPKRFRKRWTEEELLEMVSSLDFQVLHRGYHIEPDKNKKWINLIVNV
jgi:2-polyprenyl-3-methyl-5-hydroxy-6-metoxy-1,4-benzoquinol methylase